MKTSSSSLACGNAKIKSMDLECHPCITNKISKFKVYLFNECNEFVFMIVAYKVQLNKKEVYSSFSSVFHLHSSFVIHPE